MSRSSYVIHVRILYNWEAYSKSFIFGSETEEKSDDQPDGFDEVTVALIMA